MISGATSEARRAGKDLGWQRHGGQGATQATTAVHKALSSTQGSRQPHRAAQHAF